MVSFPHIFKISSFGYILFFPELQVFHEFCAVELATIYGFEIYYLGFSLVILPTWVIGCESHPESLLDIISIYIEKVLTITF